MCLILMLHDIHPDYRLIVAANRDEFYERPTAPAVFWTDAPAVLAGRDLRAGGTWLGIDRLGRFAAVTNYRQGQREPAAARSRGHLVRDYLIGRVDLRTYLAQVQVDSALYNGFNLIAGHVGEVTYFSNREGVLRELAPGVYGLSNHLLDTPWPKVSSAKAAMRGLAGGLGASHLTAELFELLSDPTQPDEKLLPETGISRDWERLLSSAFIASPEYGTRSSTVVLVGTDGQVTFGERTFGVNGIAAGEVRHAFALGASR